MPTISPGGGPSGPTSLYRYYDGDDSLLYVGITGRGMRRNDEHNQKEWWPFVRRQDVEHFDSREAALSAERAAIVALTPPFNTQHNQHHAALKAAYLAYISRNPAISTLSMSSQLGMRMPLKVVAMERQAVTLRTLTAHAPAALGMVLAPGVPVHNGGPKVWGALAEGFKSGTAVTLRVEGRRIEWPIKYGFVKVKFDNKSRKLWMRGVHLERYDLAANGWDGADWASELLNGTVA